MGRQTPGKRSSAEHSRGAVIPSRPPEPSMTKRLTSTQWLICVIASIGFAFDIYELLMLPLIIKPAIAALSAPLVDELVRGGMPRPQATAMWVPGGELYVQWAG